MNELNLTPAAVAALARGDVHNALVAATPGGIEQQEKDGQDAVCARGNVLPIEGTIEPFRHNRNGRNYRAEWEAVGFVFGERVPNPAGCGRPGGSVFVSCTFPPGWSLQPTDHSMWSDVVDDRGAKRAGVFFKAAFYDYSAHTFGLEPRFQYGADYVNMKDFSDRRMVHYVSDRQTGARLFEVRDAKQPGGHGFSHPNKDVVSAWLAEHLPRHADPLAYWGDELLFPNAPAPVG